MDGGVINHLGSHILEFKFKWDLTKTPGVSPGKESTYNEGDLCLIPGLGRSPGEGKGYPLQCFGLENPIGVIVHGVAKSQTWLSDLHFHLKKKKSL